MWVRKTDGSKMTAKPPDLRRLPPMDPALELNIKRAHYQAMLWFNCVNGEPPPGKDPLEARNMLLLIIISIVFQYTGCSAMCFYSLAWMEEERSNQIPDADHASTWS